MNQIRSELSRWNECFGHGIYQYEFADMGRCATKHIVVPLGFCSFYSIAYKNILELIICPMVCKIKI